MKLFVTGITGTLGSIVSTRLLDEGHEVVGFSRDECKQSAFPKRMRLTMYLGDVRDKARVIEASRGVDAIFHFAALKHVDLLEDNPEEAVLTNILGTQNVLHAQRVNKISRVVMASTDKAAYPINTYGMSKGIAERLVLRNKNNVVCRYGNVCASRGSAIPRFIESLKKEGKAYITDSNMTRFWITAEDAASFVISSSKGVGGLKIPTMKSCNLTLLVEVLAGLLKIKSYEMIYTGMRPGEKLAECLRTEYEGEEVHSYRCAQFTGDELSQMLAPIVRAHGA